MQMTVISMSAVAKRANSLLRISLSVVKTDDKRKEKCDGEVMGTEVLRV